MNRRELIKYCLTYPDTYEDYPFDDIPGSAEAWTVMRHQLNKKSFAFIYERGGLCVNLKCDPIAFHEHREIGNNSAFIDIGNLEQISGDEQHVIAYQISPRRSYMFSEPKNINIHVGWNNVLDLAAARRYNNIYEFISYILKNMPILSDNSIFKYNINRIELLGHFLAYNGIQLILIK